MAETIECDLVVLGGGPGGYTAAFRAADLGLSVCLVDRRGQLGGVCLHEGCIPSKTLLHGTAFIDLADQAAAFGFAFNRPKVNIETLKEKKESVIAQLSNGLGNLAKGRRITRLTGTGFFENDTTLIVKNRETTTSVVFKDAIIATGSSPFLLPGLPDDPRIWDSTDALSLDSIPPRLLIIGGGVIGLEMAQVYHALGSQITIVEMLDQIIPPADRDIVQPLFLHLKKRYQIYTRTRVTGIVAEEQFLTAAFAGKKAPESARFDAVLVAVGRRPNTDNMGFENFGFLYDKQGFIQTDVHQETTVSHIYAVGDVAGEPMLAHKATHEAKRAAESIAGEKVSVTPHTIPSVAYTEPEIAWTGLTEKDAKVKKINYAKGKIPWGASGRALSTGVAKGVTKVLFDKETGKILGAGICGAHAGELIHEAVLALEQGATAADLSKTVHAHPTLAETIAFAAESVDGSITDALPAKKK